MIGAAPVTWRSVYVVDVQLMAIGHRSRYSMLFQMRIGYLLISGCFLSMKGSSHLFFWMSSRSAAYPCVFSGIDLLVSLVSWIAAMLTLSWGKVSSSVILMLILLAFLCVSRRQLFGVGVVSSPGFISISSAHCSRHRRSSAVIGRSVTIKEI